VPANHSQSLYIRPFMIATDPCLGVNHSSRTFLFMVIASPADAYFGGGTRPVSVWLAEDYTRAAIGGTGAVKAGGN
jgi:branched-chain amino acid aminotransferase